MACVERRRGREGGLCAIMHLSRAHSHAARGIVNLRARTLSLCSKIADTLLRLPTERGRRRHTQRTCVRDSVTNTYEPRVRVEAAVSVMGNVDDDIRVAKMNFASGTFVNISSRCLGDINRDGIPRINASQFCTVTFYSDCNYSN